MADALVQHPPAMKVGGRRLSVTSRPKPTVHAAEPQKMSPGPDTPTDYPRPAPPGEQQVQKDEEEVPKRKQGNGGDEHERRIQESLYRKAEANRPTKDFKSGGKAIGAGGRISQPSKSLSV
ncbi:hypothetical protein BN946_scf184615.g17 [Trametes cinnabarina]|uniref:Uncharacterized protein n=1 Tax=Pycnoporus cinnabarinus TaxID=5643 RepID=A0A060SQP4_PYCCI|nr:hypothetical protein BN946_scf184615.g17 [Trametes cinnabarina]